MKTHLTVTILVLLTTLLYFAPRNSGVFWKRNAVSQEQTGTTAPRTVVEQHKKPPAVSVIRVSFRPLNLALIPGGITSVEEFRQRVAEDPTLNSFFGSCNVAATFQPLPDDILVFIAFRRGQEIKWTRRPLVVHKGEYVLTFCGKTVLARCGNLISWSPVQPSEDVPPSLLETPVEERPTPQASDHPALSYLTSQVAEAPFDRALGAIGSMDGAYGIKIVNVTPGSPAANAGLVPGDTVLALDGVRVNGERALDAQFANRKAGSKIIATIVHGGWTYDVTITKADGYLTSQVAEASLERVPLDRALGAIGSMDGAYGIKIVNVTPGSPAANAGLVPGDTVLALDGVRVNGERALDAQFANRKAGSKIIATIVHGGWTYDVTITKADAHTFDHSLGFLFPGHTLEINR